MDRDMPCAEALTDVAIRPLLDADSSAVLRAILKSSDYGVMFTDLDHATLACNARFGEIFEVDIDRVVKSDALAVREMVAHLIPDLDEWGRNLELVYADPLHVQVDELSLSKPAPCAVRRYTGPVFGDDGQLIGRLWTFLDISMEVRLKRMSDKLHEISTTFDDDPRRAYGRVVQAVADFYRSNAILSIQVGDFMEFRSVASEIPEFRQLQGNDLSQAYCQFVVEHNEPVTIQNGLADARTSCLLPATLGFTRYAGVPVFDAHGSGIGTLCFLDSRSEEALDDEDSRFLSMMAMRISAELAREAYLQERVAQKQAVVERQRKDLAATKSVLSAMNRGFELLTGAGDFDGLVKSQVAVLKGALAFDDVALVAGPTGADKLSGYSVGGSKKKPVSVHVEGSLGVSRIFGTSQATVVPLRNIPGHDAYLALANPRDGTRHSALADAHLEALAEQVALVLASHVLQVQLSETDAELQQTHDRLVQSEKLGVVGTLAASTAHDIKNILSSITLELGFGVDNPERALASVKDHLDRFSVLAHRLLSYAKPRMVANQTVDLDNVVQSVVALTAAHTRVTDVTVVWNSRHGPVPVLGDAHQLEHLFVNLVMNAVQAMNRSGGLMEIETTLVGDFVEVTVRDTGKGMTPDQLGRVFEPFFSTRNEGFGLGLYSCRRIVEGLGGSISATSEPGVGTVFIVRLKRA